ncbi:hypothetical protein [Luteolibacter soli]|uniref:Cardiolipin synthase N-terminal domain-containing protein n=1 Tax=Luteolibacter soli TaxID=3135280 RepID=A0ABU9AT86_9BACT
MINTLLACATCAVNFKDDGTNPAGWSILFMLGVILPMLGGVIFFMTRLIRRSDAELDPELRDDLPAASASTR